MVSDADQSGDHSADAAKNKDTAAAATQRALETMPGQTRTGLTIAFGVLGLIFFFTHRMWPKGCKRIDLIFAGDHYVEDTHAKRMLDTRLGASFTLMLPCIIGIAVVQIFGIVLDDGSPAACSPRTPIRPARRPRAADRAAPCRQCRAHA